MFAFYEVWLPLQKAVEYTAQTTGIHFLTVLEASPRPACQVMPLLVGAPPGPQTSRHGLTRPPLSVCTEASCLASALKAADPVGWAGWAPPGAPPLRPT